MHPDLATDLRAAYGIRFTAAEPVEGGWLNLKWRLDGKWLIKQYSRRRFSDRQLDLIEESLQRQILLHRGGIPCPGVLTCEGRAIRRLSDGTAYMVMEFLPGKQIGPEDASPGQLRSLGDVLGRIQRALSLQDAEDARGWPMDSSAVLDSLRRSLDARREDPFVSAAHSTAVARWAEILDSLTPDDLSTLPRGLSHEDFTPDNMLFYDDRVAAVLDFDRTQYGFLWRDAGRALLSLCLTGGGIDRARADAFLEGYARHMPPPRPADALRAVWFVEAPWWIAPSVFDNPSPKVARFSRELLWLTEHYFGLDAMFQ